MRAARRSTRWSCPVPQAETPSVLQIHGELFLFVALACQSPYQLPRAHHHQGAARRHGQIGKPHRGLHDGSDLPYRMHAKGVLAAVEEKYGEEHERDECNKNRKPVTPRRRQHEWEQVYGYVAPGADRDAGADEHYPHHYVESELLGPRNRREEPVTKNDIHEEQHA